MAFNVLSGSITAHSLVASGSFSGSFRGNGEELENVKQFDVQNQGDQRLIFYKLVNGEYQLNSDNGLTFNSSANTLLINSPKVGIGTTNPQEPLHIVSAGNGGVEIEATSGAPSLIFDMPSNEEARIIFKEDTATVGSIIFDSQGASDNDMIFKGKGTNTEIMRLNSAGNVGIGIATPSAKLDVAGNLKVSTSITASTARLTGLAFGTATTASFLALDSNNNIVLTSSVGGAGGGGGGEISYSRRFISAHATASTDDTLIGISASAPLGLQLPSAANYSAGQYFTVKDEAGNANIHNITIFASGSQKIDGSSSILLESPYAAVNLYSDGTNKFFVY